MERTYTSPRRKGLLGGRPRPAVLARDCCDLSLLPPVRSRESLYDKEKREDTYSK